MTATAEKRFAAAMNAAGRPRPAVVVPPAAPPARVLRKGDIHLGDLDTGEMLGVSLAKLIEGRLLVQGTSGAGKSWTLRRLLEQTSALVQQILVDPEGEFKTLAIEFEMQIIDATKFDTAALATVARRAREHRISILLDLSQLDREDQMKAFASFLAALVDAPKEHWHPCMIAVDEAHLFAPFGGQALEASSVRKAAIGALTDLMSRGRKRGLCGVLATQRIARLAKSVVSEAQNFLIGTNTLDLDIRRAAETIGWDARRGFDTLPSLQPGSFVAVGPAFSLNPTILKVGPVDTKHSGAAPELRKPENIEPARASLLLDLASLEEESTIDAETLEKTFTPGLRAVRSFIRDPAFHNAARVWNAVRPLVPEGATIGDLATHLAVSVSDIVSAVELLDGFGALEFLGEGADRAVRVSKALLL